LLNEKLINLLSTWKKRNTKKNKVAGKNFYIVFSIVSLRRKI